MPLTGVALEDSLPPGLAVASPSGLSGSCGAGAISADPGSQDVSLVNGTIPVGSSCRFSVDVSASAPGPWRTTASGRIGDGGAGNTTTASLTVRAGRPARAAGGAQRARRHADPVTPSPLAPPTRSLREQRGLALGLARGLVMLAAGDRAASTPPRHSDSRGCGAAGHHPRAARATVWRGPPCSRTGAWWRPGPACSATPYTTRCYAELGAQHSTPLELTRRLTARLTANAATITISGQVRHRSASPSGGSSSLG